MERQNETIRKRLYIFFWLASSLLASVGVIEFQITEAYASLDLKRVKCYIYIDIPWAIKRWLCCELDLKSLTRSTNIQQIWICKWSLESINTPVSNRVGMYYKGLKKFIFVDEYVNFSSKNTTSILLLLTSM
jgi:hypothetical protein